MAQPNKGGQKPPTVHATAGQPPTPAPDEDQTGKTSGTSTQSSPSDDAAPFPPPGEEHVDPDTAAAKAAEETKSDQQKFEEGAYAQRMATGGQGATGSLEPQNTLGTLPEDCVSADGLKKSKQPLAPEKPVDIPDRPKKDE